MVRDACDKTAKTIFTEMNYLAHARLSFDNAPVLTGNMISDFIKGKKQFDYPLPVQTGIQLHRAIDAFTDSHAATLEMREFFRPYYRLYAGAFCDVVYDHFLANDPAEFATETALQHFATGVYDSLDNYEAVLPEVFRKMLPWMKAQNWLFNYRSRWGTEKSFGGLVRRATYLNDASTAFEIFNEHYDAMQRLYNQFYPEVKSFAANQLQQLSMR
ncbi:MAG: ACP phosphodiesterase [Ferruginibacter sp.]